MIAIFASLVSHIGRCDFTIFICYVLVTLCCLSKAVAVDKIHLVLELHIYQDRVDVISKEVLAASLGLSMLNIAMANEYLLCSNSGFLHRQLLIQAFNYIVM